MHMLSSVTEAVGACTDEVDGFGNACEQPQSRIHNRCLRAKPWMFTSLDVRLYGRREHALAALAAHLRLPQPDRFVALTYYLLIICTIARILVSTLSVAIF